jgi:tetratricopeptide (TPR) repeat protein
MDIRRLLITRTWSLVAAAGVLAVLTLAGAAAPAKALSPAEAYRAGMRQFACHDLAEAHRCFQDAAGRGSGYVGLCAWNMVGQVARLQGDLPLALEAFTAVEKGASSIARSGSGVVARNVAVLGELAVLYQAEILESQEKWDTALHRYEHLLRAAAQDPRGREWLVQDPYCRERIARLYWRCGRLDEALRELQAVLTDTPDYPRAPWVRLIVLSLSRGTQGEAGGRLTCLSAPLEAADETTGLIHSSGNPLLEPLQKLIASLSEGSIWLPVLRLRCGWMLLEAGQQKEALEQFRVASSLAGRGGASLAPVRGYADLSLALCCARHGDPDEASRMARQVVAVGGRGHLQEVAAQILASLGWRRDQQRKADKCSTKPLP